MNYNKTLIFALLIATGLTANAQRSQVWCPDNGDGTFTNPVLYADYSDPDVCVVGDDYYLTASSFNCIPGLPVLHSKDLVNWQIIGHALQELQPADLFDRPQHGNGVWAPSIRHHDDTFYIYWGDPDHGVFMVKTNEPAGEWEAPVCVIPGKGMIDTCPLWDDDGRCYLVNGWAGSRAGFNSVLTVRELSSDGTRPISNPVIVFDGGQENHTAEGPKFYKRDGYYWILCPAGGVETGWQLAMRAKSPYGPYEWKRVMWQGKTDINGPHQGGWVKTPFGEDWFLHFNDKGAYGRVVYLQPVNWSSGWPIMGNDGEPVTTFKKPKSSSTTIINPVESDEFDGLQPGKQWQWHANYKQTYGMEAPGGVYRMYTHDLGTDATSLWEAPNLLLQKPAGPAFTATTKVRFASKEDGQYGGIIMMGMDYSALVVQRKGEQFILQRHTCHDADKGKPETQTNICTLQPTECDKGDYAPAIYIDIFLRMNISNGSCRFEYSLDNKQFHPAGDPFAMRKGKWIGAKLGFLAECKGLRKNRGWLDIDYIRIRK